MEVKTSASESQVRAASSPEYARHAARFVVNCENSAINQWLPVLVQECFAPVFQARKLSRLFRAAGFVDSRGLRLGVRRGPSRRPRARRSVNRLDVAAAAGRPEAGLAAKSLEWQRRVRGCPRQVQVPSGRGMRS